MTATIQSILNDRTEQSAKKAERRARRVASASAMSPFQQLDLFADGPVEALAVTDEVEVAQATVDAALIVNADIFPNPEAEPKTKEALDFARFMRLAGATKEETKELVAKAPEVNSDRVMTMLAAVEATLDEEESDPEVEELTGEDPEPEDDSVVAAVEREVENSNRSLGKADNVMSDSALGLLLKSIRGPKYDRLTPDEEQALVERIREGDIAARNALCDHNMRFLVFYARRFAYMGRPLEYLVTAGMEGLMEAANRFDPNRGTFASCAAMWIRQSIQREVAGDALFTTPTYLRTKESKLRKAAAAADSESERARLQGEADVVLREIKNRGGAHVSLDGGSDDDSDSSDMHNMFASQAAGPQEQLESRQLLSLLVNAASTLEDRRAGEIFMLRIGLHPKHMGVPRTLEEVSEVFNITRERVRQIYQEAAHDVANAVIVAANGVQNLPPNFRQGLLKPSKV